MMNYDITVTRDLIRDRADQVPAERNRGSKLPVARERWSWHVRILGEGLKGERG